MRGLPAPYQFHQWRILPGKKNTRGIPDGQSVLTMKKRECSLKSEQVKREALKRRGIVSHHSHLL